MRSFRSALALRAAGVALTVAAVVLLAGILLLRRHLLSSLDNALLEVAEIEAQIGASREGSTFLFRTGNPPRRAAEPSAALSSLAQLLDGEGRPGIRSSTLTSPLPVPRDALAEARAGRVGFGTVLWEGHPIRTVIYPLVRLGEAHRDHYLQVARTLDPVEQTLGALVRLLVLLGLLGTGAAWWATWAVAGKALRPALALSAEVEAIGVNELGRRVQVPAELSEFHRMAEAFNGLLQRLERAVIGTRRFTSDASHELRAPLTVLRGELELALSRPRSAAEYEEVLRRCLDEVLRLARLADDLLTLARVEGGVVGGKRNPVELEDAVQRAVTRQAALAAAREVTVEVAGNGGMVEADGDLLVRAIAGLVEHAIMASPKGGRVRVRVADGGAPSVEVTDSGTGLRDDEISGVFQRFYRSKRPRAASRESGLGLPIARAVALSHGGSLDYVGNDPGASFRLALPPMPG